MSKNGLVTTCDAIRRGVLAKRASGTPWRVIAAELKVKPGTLCRWIKTGWEPKSNVIRLQLGLPPAPALAPVCSKCGVVHIAKRCPSVKPTFEQNAADYRAWLGANADKLQAIVAWADSAPARQ